VQANVLTFSFGESFFISGAPAVRYDLKSALKIKKGIGESVSPMPVPID
jgi:hypothetical protein